MILRLFSFLTISALLVRASQTALAAELKPSTLVANPAAYDGKSVSVAGTVTKYQTSKTFMGPVAAFQLCDAGCIVVIDETATAHKDGDIVSVSGTFTSTFKGPKRSFKNAVVIK